MEALHDGEVVPQTIVDLVESFRSEQGGRSFIILGGYGLHNLLQAKPVFNSLVKPLWSLIQPLAKDVGMIVLGVHSLQDNVLEQHRENMNNKRVVQYNTLMARLCRQLPVPFFDTLYITSQSDSFDGVHYGFRVNALKAQLLLSVIKDGYS